MIVWRKDARLLSWHQGSEQGISFKMKLNIDCKDEQNND
jgi:hypothetical protein